MPESSSQECPPDYQTVSTIARTNCSREHAPLGLLLEVGLATADNLLHDLDVVLGLSARSLGSLDSLVVNRLAGLTGLADELQRKLIQSSDAAGLGVESTTGCAEGAAVLVEVLSERGFAATTLVRDGLLVRASLEELDRRVRLDVELACEVLVLRSVGIKVGYNALYTGLSIQHFSQRTESDVRWTRRQSFRRPSRVAASCSCSGRTTVR